MIGRVDILFNFKGPGALYLSTCVRFKGLTNASLHSKGSGAFVSRSNRSFDLPFTSEKISWAEQSFIMCDV